MGHRSEATTATPGQRRWTKVKFSAEKENDFLELITFFLFADSPAKYNPFKGSSSTWYTHTPRAHTSCTRTFSMAAD